MNKIDPKEWRTLAIILVASGLILGAMHLIPTPSSASAAISPELRSEVIKTITPISAASIRQKIQASGGKQTFLMIYASWCPHCRTAIPNIINWKEQGALDDVQLIMLSSDQKPEQLIRYLGADNLHKAFTPYVFQPESENGMAQLLSDYNMGFKGGIPYGAMFDKQGKLIAETTSGGGWEDITNVINGARY